MHTADRCDFGFSRTSTQGGNSTRCVDNIRTMAVGEMVEIDTTHAALQGCARRLPESNDFALTCHTFSSANPQAGVGITTVHVFGSRALGPPYPALGDIGRKLGMCFQARACPTCCYGLQHCVTVEIVGHIPKIKLPLVTPKCAAASFRSDQTFASMLPSVDQYGNPPRDYMCVILGGGYTCVV